MKLVVVVDGNRYEVDVDLVRQAVRVGGHEWPIQLGASGDGSVSFEILGERIEVRRDPSGNGTPVGSVTVNGELHSLVVESTAGSAARPRVPPTGSGPAGAGVAPPTGTADSGPGHAILPPMPGKVLEVRVRDGELVQAGQVLLVLEAMKMRNEVASPVAGQVAGLRVSPGANVSAHEVLLRVLAP
ncbi:MAG: biotin/lipoyl-containing protein [Thermoplasmata archaeon]